MFRHRRYLNGRNERLEKQSRWLTIVATATIVIILIAIVGGPTVVEIIMNHLSGAPG